MIRLAAAWAAVVVGMEFASAALAEPAYVRTDLTDSGSFIFTDVNSIRTTGTAARADVMVVTPGGDDPRYALVQVTADCAGSRLDIVDGYDFRINGERLGRLSPDDPGEDGSFENSLLTDMMCGRASS